MGAAEGERVLVVTDEPLRTIGYALHQAARALGHEVVLVEITPRPSNGAEPPAEVADMMAKFDVVLCPTSKSLTHTDARRAASAAGARVATLPGVTEAIMVRCMNADYKRIAERTFSLCAELERRSRARAGPGRHRHHDADRGAQGLREQRPVPQPGRVREPADRRSLPRPARRALSNGIVVVDGSMAGIGVLSSPIRIVVKDGYAGEITGGAEAARRVSLLEPHGRDARTVAEFGIGTNDKAILTGVILEDEKVMGTIHIAFGDNKSMGGTVRVASHLDGLITRPTVWFDDARSWTTGACWWDEPHAHAREAVGDGPGRARPGHGAGPWSPEVSGTPAGRPTWLAS